MNNSIRENTPNASKLIDSLRNTGYNNISAVADLVDNSIDAGAESIWFSIEPTKNDFRITLADDGSGMSEHILDEAMRLGSDTERNENSDLGKFGMGLVTASISIGKRLTVITRQDGETLTSIQDLDEIAEMGKFVKELRPATSDEEKIFNRETKKSTHGTVLLIEKCDRIQNTNINELCAQISKQLGQIFRMFLPARKIYVRGTEVKAVDPLFLEAEGTQVYSDETFDVTVGDIKEDVRIRIVALPAYDRDTNRRLGINERTEGFYLLRNNREIAFGEDLGIFTKHNRLNRLRMEIFFSAHLDNEMGVNFQKRDIKPKQAIIDKIQRIAYPQIRSFENRIKRETAAENSEDIDHDSAAKNITAKSNILINPKEKFTPRMRTGEHPGTVKPTGTGAPKSGEGAEKDPAAKMNCEFAFRDFGTSGVLFETEQVGKKVMIFYNVSHPFYQDFIAANKDNKDVINAVDYLVYSLASAQLVNQNQDNQSLFDNFNSIFSSNLRTLIS